jgi:hypothetical protein
MLNLCRERNSIFILISSLYIVTKLKSLSLKRKANKIRGKTQTKREVSMNMERRAKRRKIYQNYLLKRNPRDHQTNKFY